MQIDHENPRLHARDDAAVPAKAKTTDPFRHQPFPALAGSGIKAV